MSVIDTLRGIIKAPAPGDIGATVPLTYDIGNASYPDVSFANLASEGYIKSEIVHACIRELAVGAASAQYQVIAPSPDGGTVAVERGPLFDLMKRPNPAMSWYQFIEEYLT